MFPGYPSTSSGSRGVKDEPFDSDRRPTFPSYNRSTERILEERRKRKEEEKAKRALQKAKEARVFRSYRHIDESDEDSDGGAPTVPAETAFSEHLNGIISRRIRLGKKTDGSDSENKKHHKRKHGKDSKMGRSSSSDSEERRKKSKKSRRHRSSSSETGQARTDKKIKRETSSSSDSDKRRKKSKKSRHHRSSSSDSEPAKNPVVRPRPKYSYMVDSDDIRHNIFQDFHDEPTNFQFESVYSRHRSCYYTNISLLRTPGQPSFMDNVFSSAKDINRVPEEKCERSLISQKPIKFNPRKREYLFRKIDFPTNCDFMPLSNYPFEEFRYPHEIESERIQQHTEREKSSNPTLATEEIDIKLRNVNSDIKINSQKPELYHQFLDLVDRRFKLMVELGETTDSQGKQAHNERKLAILQMAIKNCPRDVDLKVMKINILMKDGLTDDADKEWKTLLNVFPNRCSLWAKYLDNIQYSATRYSSTKLEHVFDLCDQKLTGLTMGTIKSHSAEPGTEAFQFNCFIRRLKWLLACGFSERAIASLQVYSKNPCYNIFSFPATLDLNCGTEGFDNVNRSKFERFWDTNVARFGDIGSRGFIDFDSITSDETIEQIRLERVEFEKFKDQRASAIYRCQTSDEETFADFEREMSELCVRPGRVHYDEEVEYSKIQHCELFTCNLRSPMFKHLYELFSVFGATIYSRDSRESNTPGFFLANDFGVPPPYQDFPVSCLERVLSMMKNCFSIFGEDAASMIYSMIPVKARLLAADKHLSCKEKFDAMSNLPLLVEGLDFFKVESRKFAFAYLSLVEMNQFASTTLLKEKWSKKVLHFLNKSQELYKLPNGKYNCLLLQIHLALLVAVAENEKNDNIGDFITRWILGLKQADEISPNQILLAKKKLYEMRSVAVSEPDEVCPFTSKMLQNHVVYCNVLLMYLDYSAKSVGSWVDCIQREFLSTGFHQQNWLLHLTYLNLLLRQRVGGMSHRQFAVDHAIRCVQMFPENKRIWKTFCDIGLTCHYLSKDRFKLSNLENNFGESAQDMYCLAKIKWELHDKKHNGNACKLATERAQATSDPFWWRLAIKYATPQNQPNLYVKAANNCRWSKQLHLDLFEAMPETIEMQILESGIRMVSSTDEYKILRQAGSLS